MKKIILMVLISCFIMHIACTSFETDEVQSVVVDTIVSDNIEFYIPFQLIDNRIVISTRLNGLVDIKLAVDNGVYNLHLTEIFAKKYADSLNITLYPETPAMGSFQMSPNQKSYLVKGDFKYNFGDSTYVNYNSSAYFINKEQLNDFAYVMSGGDVSQDLPNDVVGIMPLKCLSKNGVIKIDFEKKRFEFPKQVDSSVTVYDYRYVNGCQVVQFPMVFFSDLDEKRYILSSVFDLGYRGNEICLWNNRMLKSIDVYAERNISTSNLGNFSFYFFRNIKIGKDNTLVKNIYLVYLKNIHDKADALLGIKVISKFDIWFDYQNQKIYLKPLVKEFNMSNNEFSINYGLGFTREYDGHGVKYYVSTIRNDDKKVDVKLNDELLKIDNFSIEKANKDSIGAVINYKNRPNQSITVKRGNDTLILHRIRE